MLKKQWLKVFRKTDRHTVDYNLTADADKSDLSVTFVSLILVQCTALTSSTVTGHLPQDRVLLTDRTLPFHYTTASRPQPQVCLTTELSSSWSLSDWEERRQTLSILTLQRWVICVVGVWLLFPYIPCIILVGLQRVLSAKLRHIWNICHNVSFTIQCKVFIIFINKWNILTDSQTFLFL